MARGNQTVENTEADAAVETEGKAKVVRKGKLPEGYGTPTDIANYFYATPALHSLHTDKDGNNVPVFPGVVFAAKNGADESDPFPAEIVTDSNGLAREAHKIDDVIAWWIRKNERKAEAKANGGSKPAGSIDAQIATAKKRIETWTVKLAALEEAKANGLTSLPKDEPEVAAPVELESGAE